MLAIAAFLGDTMPLDMVTVCNYTYAVLLELLGHKNYIRVLLALEKGPLRFSELKKTLKLNPVQIDRALRFLRKGRWVVPRAAAEGGGRMLVRYRLGRRGEAFIRSFKSFSDDLQRQDAALGASEVRELRSLYG